MEEFTRSGAFSPEEYLRFDDDALEKHEYRSGKLWTMQGGTPEHSQISLALGSEIRTRLKGRPCVAFESNLRLRIGPEEDPVFAYPDVSVVCGPREMLAGNPNTVTNPLVVLEVLSDSTEAYDLGEKFDAYREVLSVREIVHVAQRLPVIRSFFRRDDGIWELSFVRGLERFLALRSLGIVIPLAEIYAGIEFRPLTDEERFRTGNLREG